MKRLVPLSALLTLICAASVATVALGAQTACGTLIGFAGGPAGDPKYLLTIASGAASTEYRLAGTGTAPADLGALFAAKTPQLLQISGTQLIANTDSPLAINLTDFTVTRVASCTLPSTSTAPPIDQSPAWIMLGGMLTAFAVVVPRRRTHRSPPQAK